MAEDFDILEFEIEPNLILKSLCEDEHCQDFPNKYRFIIDISDYDDNQHLHNNRQLYIYIYPYDINLDENWYFKKKEQDKLNSDKELANEYS